MDWLSGVMVRLYSFMPTRRAFTFAFLDEDFGVGMEKLEADSFGEDSTINRAVEFSLEAFVL